MKISFTLLSVASANVRCRSEVWTAEQELGAGLVPNGISPIPMIFCPSLKVVTQRSSHGATKMREFLHHEPKSAHPTILRIMLGPRSDLSLG